MTDYPFPKASPKHRLGQLLLEFALFIVTLGIGYLVWFLIILGQGQTPGKQVLKLRVYDSTTGKPAKWGHMFIREFGLDMAIYIIAYGLPVILSLQSLSEFDSDGYFELSIGNVLYYGVIAFDAFWIFKSGKRQRLVDVICKTDVLNEAAK
jgi:uncharacterized RDD family membrane protein YckC